jgi:TonB family protein
MEKMDYLLKTALAMAFFYGLYWAFLRWHTHFWVNRVYLLTAIFISLGLPFAEIETEIEEPTIIYNSVASFPIADVPLPVASPPTIDAYSTNDAIWGLYWLGVLLMLTRLLVRLARLATLINTCQTIDCGLNVQLKIATNEQIPTFSFLHYLVINPNDYAHFFDDVLRHESVHIAQKHSFDILLIEIIHVFWWFNPILILYKRSLQAIHEFLADEGAAQTHRVQYAHRLFAYTANIKPQPLTNPFFNHSSLKYRIAMLCKNRSSRWVLGRYLLALPVVVLVGVLVAARVPKATEKIVVKGIVADTQGIPIADANVVVKNGHIGTSTDAKGAYLIQVDDNATLVVTHIGYESVEQNIDKKSEINIKLKRQPITLGEIVATSIRPAITIKTTSTETIDLPTAPTTLLDDPDDKIYKIVTVHPEFIGGAKALQKYIVEHLKYPEAAIKAHVSGHVFLSFVVRKNGKVTDIQVLKGLGFGCDEMAVQMMLSMPAWRPGKNNGKAVSVRYNLPVNFVLPKSIDTKISAVVAKEAENNPEFVGGKAELNKYLAKNLKYPASASRANVEGKVFVGFTVKQDGSVGNLQIIKGIGFGCDEEAIRLVAKMPNWKPATQNGKPVAVDYHLPITFVLEGGSPQDKGSTINSEVKHRFTNDGETIFIDNSGKVIKESYGAKTKTVAQSESPLYIVDGQRMTDKSMIKNIDPNDIKSIDMLKPETAIAIYGEDGRQGVVVVSTKNNLYKRDIIAVNETRPTAIAPLINKQISVLPDNESANKKPLWIVDGIVMDTASMSYLKKFTSDQIKSMTVEKNPEMIQKYGQAAKDGVVFISTDVTAKGIAVAEKKYKPRMVDRGSRATISFEKLGGLKGLCYFINNRKVDDISYLQPNEIAKIELLQKPYDLLRYGTGCANGVVLVTLVGKTPPVQVIRYTIDEVIKTQEFDRKSCYVIDNKVVNIKKYQDEISRSYRVHAPEDAIKKYGSKCKNGAIEFKIDKGH